VPIDRHVDIAVVGAGAAGLMAACAAAPYFDTVLLTDRAFGACNSAVAQGGLQVPLPDAESRERFVADIVRSARVPVNMALVRNFVDNVGECVEQLEQWGLVLDRDGDGALIRQRAGGLSDPRIVSAGDSIGTSLMRVLRERAEACGAQVTTHTRVVRIVPGDGYHILELRDRDGAAQVMRAAIVIAATGGLTYRLATQRGEPTTNPRNENHVLYDGLSELGLERVHEEFFQYQPFGIVSFDTGSLGRCVPESIVNYPVRLLDRHGDLVCDLASDRLAVTEAMRHSMRGGDAFTAADGRPSVLLTLSDVPDDELRERLPKLASLLERHGALGGDLLVRPFLHYQLGGFRTGLDGRTAVPGLFLAGEMTGGLHGRNRLMGNGITDSLVRGRLSGKAAVSSLQRHRARTRPAPT
jgi:succinate dehydrogenase/fumarate reductase flavoprotein subunit